QRQIWRPVWMQGQALKIATTLISVYPGSETIELIYPIYCEPHHQKWDDVFAPRSNGTAVAKVCVARLDKRDNNCECGYRAQVENCRQAYQNAKPERSPGHHEIRASTRLQP